MIGSEKLRRYMSKIPIADSLVVARKVVRALEKIIPKELAKDCRVESWSNCREQGLCIKRWSRDGGFDRRVVVAEARSSDSILVVTGTYCDFDMQTNQPSDEAWHNRQYFDCGEYELAAKYILKIFKKNRLTVKR